MGQMYSSKSQALICTGQVASHNIRQVRMSCILHQWPVGFWSAMDVHR